MGFLKSLIGCFTFTISDKVADCGSSEDDDGHDKLAIATTKTTSHVNKFSWEEIRKQTKNLSTVIGSGGFSTVYLARLPDSGLTAVKIQSACTDRLARIHDQELQILLRLKHPNIVRFLGHSSSCCDDREQGQERALLFEYASNGTLHDNLIRHGIRSGVTLTWKTRTLIAFQLATALEYLHGIQIIHGDIKSSNILLDQQQNCKLCDFGSAKSGFTSMVLPPSSTKSSRMRMIMGSQGYVDPHYLKTGLVSKKNDVYSFGVVLLELITGREAFSLENKLTEIIGPAVKVEEVVDPRLRYGGDGYDLEEVKAMLSVADKCIGCSPMVRPCASQIVASMRENISYSFC